MKKLLLLLSVLSISYTAKAQDYAVKFSPVGLYITSYGGYSGSTYMTTLDFEAGLTDKMSINAGLNILTSGGGVLLKPELRFYLTDDVMTGVYVGPYAGIGTYGSLIVVAGGTVGYQHLFDGAPISLSGGLSTGLQMWSYGDGSGNRTSQVNLNFHPTISVGYTF